MNGCVNCGEQLPEGARFCPACGAEQTAPTCASCGAALLPTARFCFSCGAPVPDRPAAATGQVTVAGPVASRRVTSVLFGDLVGFTALSETRDQEEVRELLSRYFDECRAIVARYGGTVEKFIGDAVMAVWGVPTAHEDDAERAVRAGLELVDADRRDGPDIGVPDLAMRVGIVTGEVAVTIGAEQQGMVAGDAVNTASRVQSAAAPGQVWVDETTRLLTSSAITYVDVGSHAMKGKAEPVPLWAVRAVVAARRRRPARRRSRGAAGRPRPRDAAGQGALPPRRGDRAPGAAGRRRRGRASGKSRLALGVREVRRRPQRQRALAHRPLPVVRRGRGVLRAGRGDPGPAPGAAQQREGIDAEDAVHGEEDQAELLAEGLDRLRDRPRRARLAGAADGGAARGSGRSGPSRARTCSRRGRRSCTGQRQPAAGRRRWCCSSTTRSTPTTGCCSSSSTCWPSRPSRASSCCSPDPACSRPTPGSPPTGARPSSTSTRSPRARWVSCSTGWSAGSTTPCATRSWPGPRASRSSPSRRCAR